ncbi:MAG: hypothetical protein ACRDWD_08640 [Acidimicrobiia bacterium]
MSQAVTTPTAEPVALSEADLRVRRFLRIPDPATGSITGAQSAFSRSILISAVRCLLTYVVIPLLGPILGVSGAVGPWLGLTLGLVSMTAIVLAVRRLFAANHRWRWGYLAFGGSVFVLLIVQAAIDISSLVG